jgi:iron complex outermembrane recepter protein
MSRKQYKPLLMAGLLLSAYTSVSQAQSPGTAASGQAVPPEQADAYSMEEIVVTARRKQENIQEVPLSITAMSSDDLARESITSAQDLMGKVGSLVIGPNNAMRNSETPNIRGQGATFGANAGVAMYWAEVPLPSDSFANNQGGPGMFFDVQNLQVLKGPQGTLFGRNTTGGAFVIEPTKPQDTFSARVQGETGNYNDRGYEAVVNVPLYSDRLLLRIGGQSMQRDGYTKDIITGKDYDDRNYWTSRLGLTLRVGDSIENTLLTYYTERDENGTGNVIEGMNPDGINSFLSGYLGVPLVPGAEPNAQSGCANIFNPQAPSTNCGLDIVAEQQARDIRHVQLSADPFDKLETGAAIDIFSWQISDSLTLRNILSRSFYKRRFAWDQDGSRAQLNDITQNDASLALGHKYSSDTETTTEELQLQGSFSDIGLSYVTGVYHEEREPQSTQLNPTVALFFPIVQTYEIENRSQAIYAQTTLDMSSLGAGLDGWILTAGVRRTSDEVDGTSLFDAGVFELPKDEETKQYATTWLLSASYQFDTAMVYGKIARGYKAGGFTGLAANPSNYFYDPEYVTNYELGLKSDTEVAEMPLRLNAAVFFSDYTDMQRVAAESYDSTPNEAGGVSFGLATFNAGESEIKGFEMDFILLATDRVRLMGNYSYTDAEFKEFKVPRSSLSPQADCVRGDVQNGEIGDYSCMPFSDIPEQQYSLSINYELPLDVSVGTVETSLTYAWVDDRYTAALSIPSAEPGAWLDDFGVFNASVSWREIFETNVDVQLFGTNLTDEEYRISNSNSWGELAFQNSIWSEPRMYGLRATYRWGDE